MLLNHLVIELTGIMLHQFHPPLPLTGMTWVIYVYFFHHFLNILFFSSSRSVPSEKSTNKKPGAHLLRPAYLIEVDHPTRSEDPPPCGFFLHTTDHLLPRYFAHRMGWSISTGHDARRIHPRGCTVLRVRRPALNIWKSIVFVNIFFKKFCVW